MAYNKIIYNSKIKKKKTENNRTDTCPTLWLFVKPLFQMQHRLNLKSGKGKVPVGRKHMVVIFICETMRCGIKSTCKQVFSMKKGKKTKE